MNKYSYIPKGVCSTLIEFDLDESDNIHNLLVSNGCNGNLKGISKLVEGRNRSDVIDLLSGIKCGFKNTSCPDQIAKALKSIEEK